MTEHEETMKSAGRCLLRARWRSNGGVSALELGLVGPILCFGLVATADLGLALCSA